MAAVKFIETTSANLSNLPVVDGQIIFVTDTELMYRDTASKRTSVSGSKTEVAMSVSNHTLNITLS